jgi:hypothetical protein
MASRFRGNDGYCLITRDLIRHLFEYFSFRNPGSEWDRDRNSVSLNIGFIPCNDIASLLTHHGGFGADLLAKSTH